MTRDELEAVVRRQVRQAAAPNGKLFTSDDMMRADVHVTVIMANVDAHVARALEAEIERLAGAEPHASCP